MELPLLPPVVTSLVASGTLPGAPGRRCWPVPSTRRYADLDDVEFGATTEIDEHTDRAIALIEEALGHGVPDAEVRPLWDHAHRVGNVAHLAHDHEACLAEHGAPAEQRPNAILERAHAHYEAGDRGAALPLFRDVAEADVWGGFSGAATRSDIGWCRLLHDAAHHDGADAVRAIWQEAKTSRHAARFPHPEWSAALIEMLLGTGVPDVLEVLAAERLDPALREDDPWELTDDEHTTLARAIGEIARDRAWSGGAGPACVSAA